MYRENKQYSKFTAFYGMWLTSHCIKCVFSDLQFKSQKWRTSREHRTLETDLHCEFTEVRFEEGNEKEKNQPIHWTSEHLTSWYPFQYSLQCLLDTFLIKWCGQLYFLHLNHIINWAMRDKGVGVSIRLIELNSIQLKFWLIQILPILKILIKSNQN